MESSEPPTAASASAALRDAAAARTALAAGVTVPSWFFTSLAAAIAVQIATAAAAFGDGEPWALLAGLALFALAASVQLTRFRRCNGVRLGGLASRVVFGRGAHASAAYAAALAAAIWAAVAGPWWLVGLCAAAGGAAYALGGRQWLDAYRAQPAAHARGESAAMLALLALPVLAGLALLLAGA